MKISKQARRDAKQMFRISHVDGLLDENRVRQVVKQVLQGKPRGYLGILTHFERLVRLDVDRRTARVESAAALTPDVQADVQARLERAYGPGLNISFALNPGLIGGIRVKVGSDVFDGSVQARLTALQESF